MQYLMNTWYQAGWSSEVEESTLLARTLLDEPLVFYRDSNGKVNALMDRCPHKFVPLSAGCVKGDSVVCGYHGLEFGEDGACTKNPHGEIPKRLQVKSYIVAERHTAIWVWMGDPEKANLTTIPDLSFIDSVPEETRIFGYMNTACDYQLLTDNILDLSHADYLHPTTLGGMMTQAKTELQNDTDALVVRWFARNCEAPMAFMPMADENNKIDISIEVTWNPPALMVLTNSGVKPGLTVTDSDLGITLHNMVPETNGHTHYFYCSTRRFQLNNPEFTRLLKKNIQHAFENEDKPMLEKQQRSIGNSNFRDLKPVLLSIDAAGVQARGILDRLINNRDI